MKHIGIVAEYNPFHNGHQYQLQKAKEIFPDKRIITIMSGDFVQRGEPAIFNKYIRTRCALASGADIILELSPLFATASAEHFASAAVLALSATGIVDTLCFGAECDDLSRLWHIADVLSEEPEAYQTLLKEQLKTGLSFPKARAAALTSYLQDNTVSEILRYPNNILGIEYLKIIRKYQLALTPCVIKRQGSGYHETDITSPFSSATAIRNELQKKAPDTMDDFNISSSIRQAVPDGTYDILQDSDYARPLFLSDFYGLLQYALWQNQSTLHQYYDVPPALCKQLSQYVQYPNSLTTLLDELACKNYTNTRIKRALLNILLQQEESSMLQAKERGYISYLRLLGFRNTASDILKEMKKICTVPVINKVADAKKILSEPDFIQFQKDIRISTLYKQVFSNKYCMSVPSEYEQTVIIHND